MNKTFIFTAVGAVLLSTGAMAQATTGATTHAMTGEITGAISTEMADARAGR